MPVSESIERKVLTGESVGFDIKVTWLAIAKMYNPLAAEHDITVTAGFVLLIINEEHGTAATKIAPLLGMEPRSLTRLLKTMEAQKLIIRKPDASDKRSVRIILTKLGIQKKHIAMDNVGVFDQKVRANVGTEKLGVFFDVLHTIYSIAEKNKTIE